MRSASRLISCLLASIVLVCVLQVSIAKADASTKSSWEDELYGALSPAYKGGMGMRMVERSDTNSSTCLPCGVGQPYCCEEGHTCCYGNGTVATSCVPTGAGQCCVEGHSCASPNGKCCGNSCMPDGAQCCSGLFWCPTDTECLIRSNGEHMCDEGSLLRPDWWRAAVVCVVLLVLQAAAGHAHSFDN